MRTITDKEKKDFNDRGFLVISGLLEGIDLEFYRTLYEDFLSGKVDSSRYRSDLGGHLEDPKKTSVERITQIMVPSRILPMLIDKSLHKKTLSVARQLLGEDMALDFDMLIDKAPYTDTPTPWHQDCAYWIDMPDKRAVSCWVSLDEAYPENGCMWYIPGSHLVPMRAHHQAGKGGGALECEASETEGVPVPLKPGDCVLHHGGTAHYSRGNSTGLRRRAFITNFRPQSMVDYERAQGMDHTGERKVRSS